MLDTIQTEQKDTEASIPYDLICRKTSLGMLATYDFG